MLDDIMIKDWISSLESRGRHLTLAAKRLADRLNDPFALYEEVKKLAVALPQEGPVIPEKMEKILLEECQVEEAEFWQRFSVAVKQEGWELHGTTRRRLLARTIFVEEKTQCIAVEGLSNRLTLHIPTLMPEIKKYLLPLLPEGDINPFVELLLGAWETAGGKGEVSLETVYKYAFMGSQTSSFWETTSPEKLKKLSRPMFRARLAAVLESGAKASDGRSLRLGTTLNPKDTWEIFSPGEGRVVQVGRLCFE